MPDFQTVDGAALRAERERRGLKRPDVASPAGMTVAQLTRVETRNLATADELQRLTTYFGGSTLTRPELNDDEWAAATRAVEFAEQHPSDTTASVADSLLAKARFPNVKELRDRVKRVRALLAAGAEAPNGERSGTFMGLVKGDPVRVEGLKGVYKFQEYVRKEDRAPYVTVFGSEPSRKPKAPAMRSVEPEKILPGEA